MKSLTKNNKKRLIFLILVIIWMIIVFYFSNQPSDASEETSLLTTERIVEVITANKNTSRQKRFEMIQELDPAIRKLAHYSIYTLGGIIIINYINTYDIAERKKIFYSICLGAMYASSDEFHQYFVDGRSALITDVMIDSLGIATGACIFLCVVKIIEKIKK